MSRTPAAVRQADISRVIRAAKQAGAAAVNLFLPGGGSFRIDLAGIPGGKIVPPVDIRETAPAASTSWDDV
jgi:hypothetical protein